MITNIVFKFFTASFILFEANAMIPPKKPCIVTPLGNDSPISSSLPNYLQWPVPFFSDNGYGYISTSAPALPVPPASQMPSQTIGRVNSIISSPAPIDVSNNCTEPTPITTLSPVKPIINPSLMLNYSTANPNINFSTNITPKRNTQISPLITFIDPKFIITYSIQPISNSLSNSSDSSTPSMQIVTVASPSNNLTSTVAQQNTVTSTSTTNLPPITSVIDPKHMVNATVITAPQTTSSTPITLTTTSNIATSINTNSVTATNGTTNLSTTSQVTPSSGFATQTLINTSLAANSTINQVTFSSTTVTQTIINTSFASTTPTPFTSNPISSTVATSTTLSSTGNLSKNITNLSLSSVSSSVASTTPESRPLGLDCNYKPPLSLVQVVSAPGIGSPTNFQVEVPTVIKFDFNITSVPSYVISVSPINNNDSDIVEVISANVSGALSAQKNHIKLDLSDPNFNVGWSTPAPAPPTTPARVTRISQEKCIEYYNTSRRPTRKAQVQVFIIGGQSSMQKEFPHMAALGYGPKNSNQWLCGGSLISELFVITVAHCLSAKSLGDVSYVRLGTTTLQTETLNSEDYNVIRRFAHPNYVEGKQYDDLALLELDRPVTFTDYIAPICLYSGTNLASLNLIATGWGKTTENGDTAKELQKVNLDYVPNNVCRQAYDIVPKEELPKSIVDETQVCAGTADGSKDTCQGDSGGPLQAMQDSKYYLVGVTSFGIGCGTPGIPGVYTRISYYVPWIEQMVWKP